MLIKRIMRTNVDSRRLKHCIHDYDRVSKLKLEDLEDVETFEVLDEKGKKVGEMPGDDLRYLVKAMRGLNLSDVLNEMDDGVIAVDAEGRICFENEAYSRIVGVPARKTIGRNMYAIEPDAMILQALKTGKAIYKNRQLIHSVGKFVSMRIYPIVEEGKVQGAFSIFQDASEIDKLNQEFHRMAGIAREYGNQLNEKASLSHLQIVSRSPVYEKVLTKASTVASTDASVMIRGESGVGKEVIARLIHENSHRRGKPLITVNCAAIPENLIESELFGYEEGAFTGSRKGGKLGKFELAHEGTLFLDEIGDMPYAMQAKLLRVLQEGEVERVGGSKSISVDVRIIAATNQNLEELIKAKQFRQDLYFRLNVVSITVPPLRQRRDDIVPLINHFLQKNNEKYGKRITISQEAYAKFEAFDWPGNVRQLQNCVESMVIMTDREGIVREIPSLLYKSEYEYGAGRDSRDGKLEDDIGRTAADGLQERFLMDEISFAEAVKRYEQILLKAAVEACDGNRERAIEKMGISRRTFYRKLRGE